MIDQWNTGVGDNFAGIRNINGISTIIVSDAGYFMVDDLQYTSTVSLSAALWLFGTGLLGLIGMARKRTA